MDRGTHYRSLEAVMGLERAEEMERLAKLIEEDPEWFVDDFDDQVVIDALRIAAKKLREEKS